MLFFKVNLLKFHFLTVLRAFSPAPTKTFYPELGSPLTLRCDPPQSFPPAEISWAAFIGGELFPIDLTDGISIDPDGKPHQINFHNDYY